MILLLKHQTSHSSNSCAQDGNSWYKNLMIKIRPARKSDKDEILSFCINSFSWGDYIDRVWDYWYVEENGRLFIAESCSEKIAMSHVALCPDGRSIWLEGLRVHPDHRRSYIATLAHRKNARVWQAQRRPAGVCNSRHNQFLIATHDEKERL